MGWRNFLGKDKNGNHFVASSCQGLGASIWWPNKIIYDEPDSGALISVNVPKGLFNVSNGKLKSIEHLDLSSTFHWEVINPINNYGININIGDYTNFSKIYDGENGDLMMDYYVLSHNLEKQKLILKMPKEQWRYLNIGLDLIRSTMTVLN